MVSLNVSTGSLSHHARAGTPTPGGPLLAHRIGERQVPHLAPRAPRGMLRSVSPTASTRRTWILRRAAMVTIAAAIGAVALFAGCAGHHTPDFDTSGSDGSVDVPGTDAGSMASFSTADDAGTGSFGSSGGGGSTTHDDFPSPVLDGQDGGAAAAPSNAPALFGPTSQGARSGGPCLTEPGANALFPRNWLRPLFRWSAPAAQNLFELRLHTANQKSDLVVYTASTSWTMPKALWDLLRLDSNDAPITVTIRGGTLSGGKLSDESLGSQTTIGVAPADAPGTIVYWTSADGTTLKGFQVGDETVGSTLVTSQVQEVTLGTGQCMGCHTGAPDGEYSILAESGNNWGDFVALVDPDAGAVGSAPSFLGAGAKTTLSQGPLGMSAVSKAHWSQGDHVMLASDDTDIVWVDPRVGGPQRRPRRAPPERSAFRRRRRRSRVDPRRQDGRLRVLRLRERGPPRQRARLAARGRPGLDGRPLSRRL